MFRRAFVAGIRFIRAQLIGSIRIGGVIQNGVIRNTSKKPEVNFKNFFFAHWLQNASRFTRARSNPIYQIVGNRRNPTPSLFLAFAGFTYLGVKDDVTSRSDSCSKGELHCMLQDMLQKTATNIPEKPVNHNAKSLKDYDIKERLGKASSNSAVYSAQLVIGDFNECALKMVLNYDTNSRSESLTKAFSKELAILSNNEETQKIRDESGYTNVQGHFNIMKIVGHFTDTTPLLYDAMENYPAALPSRFHPDGFGRNRTMFLVMPIFQGTLQEYIARHKDNPDPRKLIALLAQLFEGLLHLYNKKVAHRDLKSDNILVDENKGELPHLVITDFDCALAEEKIGFNMPYETNETSKGGNWLLMAPEVALAKPGPGKKIDNSRADAWAAGILTRLIFGQKLLNLDKKSYKVTELPELKGAPKAVQRLAKELLQRHPNDRPDLSLAATVCQMLLWAPGLCIVNNKEAVRRWLEQETWALTLDILKCRFKEDIPVEKQILLTFLSRTSVDEIMRVIEWLNQ